jgi:hypothetical protein
MTSHPASRRFVMENGTVKEKPVDPATLPTIKAANPRGKPRISIVNEDAPLEPKSAINGAKAPPSANSNDEPLPSATPENKARRPENHVQ